MLYFRQMRIANASKKEVTYRYGSFASGDYDKDFAFARKHLLKPDERIIYISRKKITNL